MEAARARPGELTALITAPLTNFALAIRREPRLPELLGKVVIMGGSFYHQGNTTPTAEWNTHVDPHAAKEVYAAYRGLPVERLPIICSLDTTERIEMRPEHVLRLAEAAGCPNAELVLPEQPEGLRSTADSPLVRHLSDALRFYFEFHRHTARATWPTSTTTSPPVWRPGPSTTQPGRPPWMSKWTRCC